MKLKYMLDTNICIYISKNKPSSVAEKFRKLTAGSVSMSLITFGELAYGAEKSIHSQKNKQILNELCSLIPPLPLDLNVAAYYGHIRANLEKNGQVIGNNDLWIAAHALSLKLVLVTNNHREFSRIKGLKIENWVAKKSVNDKQLA